MLTFVAGVVLAVPFMWYVPVIPFAPECEPFHEQYVSIKEPMSDEYREVLLKSFDYFGIRYWDIAGRVLIPIYTWATGDATDDESGLNFDLGNAYRKPAIDLAREKYSVSPDGEMIEMYGASLEGTTIAGKVYRVPDHVKTLVGRPGAIIDPYRCEVLYAVVTGRPATDEMLKRWYTPPKRTVFYD